MDLRLRTLLTACGAVWLAAAPGATTVAAPGSAGDIAPACAGGGYRQLDFWIGDWDTFEADDPRGASIARARIAPVAQGCGLHELYEQGDGLIGDSLLSYDPVRGQWQQTWVTNRGALMVLWGGWRDGALVLEGESHLADGSTVRQRITWRRQGDAARESAVLSKDGGRTWAPAFDVVFRKRVGAGG